MPREDGAGQIIEAFPTVFALIALPGWLFFIEASSDHSLGITKRTLFSFRPAKLPNSVITLGIIYQVLYIYLHMLDSFRQMEKVGSLSTTPRPRNPT